MIKGIISTLFLWPVLLSGQKVVDIQKDFLVFSVPEGWTISSVSDRYGRRVEASIRSEKEEVVIGQLQSGSVYAVDWYSAIGGSTDRKYYATRSNSSGEIKTYFNYELPSWEAGELEAEGTTFGEVEKAVRDAIKAAKKTVDYCAYNTNVAGIVNALIDATARGVQVRVIVESENSNSGFSGNMPFPILRDKNSGLMHNKFVVIDADNADDARVINGAMNFTMGQMASDPNHLHIIADQSLARAYEMEFEEMWGSSGPDFDLSTARFGSEKTDNTPHEFVLGDVYTELYFSPSDGTAGFIADAVKTASHHLDIGLLIFTYFELRDAVIEVLRSGVRVRGIVEDRDNSDGIVNVLNFEGADIKYHPAAGIYHHKMAIIDGEFPNSNPLLVSGSHNWTFSAENFNDENTLIFHDAALAQLFKRAFSAQWNPLSTDTEDPILSGAWQIRPTAFFHGIYVETSSGRVSEYEMYDITGSTVRRGIVNGSTYIDLSDLPRGMYFLRDEAGRSYRLSK